MEYIYFAIVPFATAGLLAYFRRGSARISLFITLAFAAIVSLPYLMTKGTLGTQEWVGMVIFYWVPLFLIFVVSRFAFFAKKPFALLVATPLVQVFSYIIAVNIWLALGYSM